MVDEILELPPPFELRQPVVCATPAKRNSVSTEPARLERNCTRR